jgi:hypothetical protein
MFGKNRNKKVLMVVTACLALAGIWAVLATPETAVAEKPDRPGGGGDGGKKQEIPVSVTFRDDVADGIYSDGKGPYTRTRRNKVKAFIGLDGQLRLQTWDSTVRSILLNIPKVSGCPDGEFGHANVITLGEDDNDDGILTEPQLDPFGDRLNLLAMDIGAENSTKAGLRFVFFVPNSKNGEHWYLRFGDDQSPPQAGLVTVTRENDSVWTIEAGDGDLAALVRSGQGQAPCAYVSMPFSIAVELQQ